MNISGNISNGFEVDMEVGDDWKTLFVEVEEYEPGKDATGWGGHPDKMEPPLTGHISLLINEVLADDRLVPIELSSREETYLENKLFDLVGENDQ